MYFKNDFTININSAINYNVTGILRYKGTEQSIPKSTEFPEVLPICLGVDQSKLKLLHPEPVPEPVTDNITLTISITKDEYNITRALINNFTYVADDFNPTLHKFVTGEVKSADLLPR